MSPSPEPSLGGTMAMILYRLMQWSHRRHLLPLAMIFNRLNTNYCNCIIVAKKPRRWRVTFPGEPLPYCDSQVAVYLPFGHLGRVLCSGLELVLSKRQGSVRQDGTRRTPRDFSRSVTRGAAAAAVESDTRIDSVEPLSERGVMMAKSLSLGERFLPKQLHQKLQFDREAVVQFISRKVPPLLGHGRVVLDAGSGSIEEQFFRDLLHGSAALVHSCDIARRSGLDYQSDLQRMPVQSSSYDMVICTQVLEHVKHPYDVCREFFRILKPGGDLFVTVPQTQEMHDLPNHYFNYTYYGIKLVLEETGFEVLEVEAQGGHFRMLGRELHATCNLIREAMTTPWSKVLLSPLLIGCQVTFGLFTKLVCLWLDRFDREPKNTMGWNVHCRKPCPALTCPPRGEITPLRASNFTPYLKS